MFNLILIWHIIVSFLIIFIVIIQKSTKDGFIFNDSRYNIFTYLSPGSFSHWVGRCSIILMIVFFCTSTIIAKFNVNLPIHTKITSKNIGDKS